MRSESRRTALALGVIAIPLLIDACKSGTEPASTANTNVAVLAGNHQPGLVGFGVNIRPAVRVTNASSNPVPNATVTFAVVAGGGSISGGVVTTDANGVAQVGRWTLGGAAGINTLTATVSGTGVGGNPVTFTDTALAAGYTIQIQYFGPTPSATVQTAMNAAVSKWERIIYRALSSITLNVAAKTACGDTTAPAINQVLTGLLILAKFDSIDGPGKVLGQSGPCAIRNSSGLTVLGAMEFDTADVATLNASGSLNLVMLHEMGHVLGFGTLWDSPPNNCLQLPSDSTHHLDTFFSCAKARAAFDSIGGTSYTGASLNPPGGNKVPVENCGASSPSGCGTGTRNGHWREPVLGNELMTGYVTPGQNPLSVLSVAAQEDLGYTVNYAAADPYVRVFTAPAAAGAAPLFLGDDIRPGPVSVVDALGRVVSVRRR
jgi:hypothetical protein